MFPVPVVPGRTPVVAPLPEEGRAIDVPGRAGTLACGAGWGAGLAAGFGAGGAGLSLSANTNSGTNTKARNVIHLAKDFAFVVVVFMSPLPLFEVFRWPHQQERALPRNSTKLLTIISEAESIPAAIVVAGPILLTPIPAPGTLPLLPGDPALT